LANSVDTIEFLLGIMVWYEILFAININIVSKKSQSKSMCIRVTMKKKRCNVILW